MALIIPNIIAVIFLYWMAQSVFFSVVITSNHHIISNGPYYPGSTVIEEFDIIRYRDCTLDIGRYLEKIGGDREYRVEFSIGHIIGDAPFVHRRTVKIIIPEFIDSGHYRLFARIRYTCNGYDLIMPNIEVIDEAEFEVEK
jgi:hypothetical protein